MTRSQWLIGSMATPVELPGARVILTEEVIPGPLLLSTDLRPTLYQLCVGGCYVVAFFHKESSTYIKVGELIYDIRIVSCMIRFWCPRIHEALEQKLDVIDVDGSYVYRKEQQLISQGVSTLPLPLPTVPLTGRELVTADNYHQKNIPKLMPGSIFVFTMSF